MITTVFLYLLLYFLVLRWNKFVRWKSNIIAIKAETYRNRETRKFPARAIGPAKICLNRKHVKLHVKLVYSHRSCRARHTDSRPNPWRAQGRRVKRVLNEITYKRRVSRGSCSSQSSNVKSHLTTWRSFALKALWYSFQIGQSARSSRDQQRSGIRRVRKLTAEIGRFRSAIFFRKFSLKTWKELMQKNKSVSLHEKF